MYVYGTKYYKYKNKYLNLLKNSEINLSGGNIELPYVMSCNLGSDEHLRKFGLVMETNDDVKTRYKYIYKLY